MASARTSSRSAPRRRLPVLQADAVVGADAVVARRRPQRPMTVIALQMATSFVRRSRPTTMNRRRWLSPIADGAPRRRHPDVGQAAEDAAAVVADVAVDAVAAGISKRGFLSRRGRM